MKNLSQGHEKNEQQIQKMTQNYAIVVDHKLKIVFNNDRKITFQ